MYSRTIAVVASLSLFSVGAWGVENSTSTVSGIRQWVPVENDAWATFVKAPDYHFDKARELFNNNHPQAAAAELRQGTKMIRFQAQRLQNAVSDLDKLAMQMQGGKPLSLNQLDAVISQANKSLDYRQPLVPVAEGDDATFIESGRYHVAQANTALKAKDTKDAAAEIRDAVSYLKLEAAHSGRTVEGAFQSGIDELNALATKLETGAMVEGNELDQTYAKARNALKHELSH